MYKTIDIDFDVFKALTMRRETPEVTHNDIVRELLGLGPTNDSSGSETRSGGSPWMSKGVTFPHGTDFRAAYKGQVYRARVEEGALVYKGKRYTSPSPAAMTITGTQINGWKFWECKMLDSGRWAPISELRK
jgi:hypothetical protein